MLKDKISKIIPYISENFITYPLWEEGIYIPFVNFWKIYEITFTSFSPISSIINKIPLCEEKGYSIDYKFTSDGNRFHYEFSIYPEFKFLDTGIQLKNEKWSIEEMIELIEMLIK